MTRHSKFDMLVEKGKNMDLVILLKYDSMHYWEVSPNSYPPHSNKVTAFLCHPIHLDACLKGLNGGKVEINTGSDDWSTVLFEQPWNSNGWYMNEDIESRC